MATTTTVKNNFISVVWSTGISDWVFETELAADLRALERIKVKSIQFNGDAANDILVIREGSLTGPEIMRVKIADATDQRIKYFGDCGTWMKPYIEADDCTFGGTIGNYRLIFELA